MKNVQKAGENRNWLDKIDEAKGYPTYLYIWGIVVKLENRYFSVNHPKKYFALA